MKILKALSSVLFPAQCPVCGRILVKGEGPFCTACLYDIPWTHPEYPSDNDLLEKIPAGIRPSRIFSLFHYHTGSETKNLFYAIKYHNRPGLARKIGEILGNHIREELHGDMIIPVPLHKKRLKERGYNQAAEIAEGISSVTGIPVYGNILSRNRYTFTQTDKDMINRYLDMDNAFQAESLEKIRGKRVIIVDDIITTGSTVMSCLKAIQGGGAKEFILVCIARTSL